MKSFVTSVTEYDLVLTVSSRAYLAQEGVNIGRNPGTIKRFNSLLLLVFVGFALLQKCAKTKNQDTPYSLAAAHLSRNSNTPLTTGFSALEPYVSSPHQAWALALVPDGEDCHPGVQGLLLLPRHRHRCQALQWMASPHLERVFQLCLCRQPAICRSVQNDGRKVSLYRTSGCCLRSRPVFVAASVSQLVSAIMNN